MQTLTIRAVALAAAALAAGSAGAADLYWVGAFDDRWDASLLSWSAAPDRLDFSLSRLPVAGDNVHVSNAFSVSSRLVYGNLVQAVRNPGGVFGLLQINSAGAVPMRFELSGPAGASTLQTTNTIVGSAAGSSAVFVQSTGSHAVASVLRLGDAAGSDGNYTLTGGTVSAAFGSVGFAGSGTFEQSAGTASFSNYLALAEVAGSNGAYYMSGGSLTTPRMLVGFNGTGSVQQLGGTVKVGQVLELGSAAGGSGSYTLAGGATLELGGLTGAAGRSELVVQGGVLSLTGTSYQVGTLRVRGSDVVLSSGQSLAAALLDVGSSPVSANFKLDGGAVTVDELALASDRASFVLDAGVLNVGRVTGGGSLLLQGGDLHLAPGGSLALSSLVLSRGSANLAAGQTWDVQGGTLLTGNTPVQVVQTGGLHRAAWLQSEQPLAAYTLSGGTLEITGKVAGRALEFNDGTFNFNGGTLLLSAADNTIGNLNIGPAMVYTLPANLRVTGQIANQGDLTVGSTVLSDNSGVLRFDGTLTIGSSGSLANSGLLVGHGTLAGTGTITNTGTLQQQGGHLVVSATGSHSNQGTWEMLAGHRLQLDGANTFLNNFGSLRLNGGMVTGTGALVNRASGLVSGTGRIDTRFDNSGRIVAGAGQLGVVQGLNNIGRIELVDAAAQLTGGTLTNLGPGRVQGLGQVNNNIVNDGGTVRASGGTLELNGVVTNSAGSTLAAASGAELLLTRGLATNGGAIQLAGGSFDNNGQALTNAAGATINGVGTLRSGLLTNNGQIQLSGGMSWVQAGLVSNSSSKVVLTGLSNTAFDGDADFRNGSELRISAGSSATFWGQVQQRAGALFTGSGDKFYEGGLQVGASPGAVVDEGNVTFGIANVSEMEIGGTQAGTGHDALRVQGTLTFGGTLRLVSWAGFVGQAGQQFDLYDWGSVAGSFASVDVSGFMLAAGTRLDLSGLYTDGTVSVQAAQAVPEVQTWAMLLVGLAGLGALVRRRRTPT